MTTEIFKINFNFDFPLVATAIHDGHEVRSELSDLFQLSATERLREEDPHTGFLARQFSNTIVGTRSRFEADLNRAPDKAIYQKPEDAWGLTIWKNGLPQEELRKSQANYKLFYSKVEEALANLINKFGYAIVYDLHTYNHRRNGPDGEIADPQKNPEINLGLGNMDLTRWRPVVDTFKAEYSSAFGKVDMRENVKFNGGYFMHHLHKTFGSSICVIAIEFKKTFMDEWTNVLDEDHLKRIAKALYSTKQAVLKEAESINQPA